MSPSRGELCREIYIPGRFTLTSLLSGVGTKTPTSGNTGREWGTRKYGTEEQIPPFLATLGRRNDKGMKNPHLVAESRDKFGAAARIDPKTSVELRSRS